MELFAKNAMKTVKHVRKTDACLVFLENIFIKLKHVTVVEINSSLMDLFVNLVRTIALLVKVLPFVKLVKIYFFCTKINLVEIVMMDSTLLLTNNALNAPIIWIVKHVQMQFLVMNVLIPFTKIKTAFVFLVIKMEFIKREHSV